MKHLIKRFAACLGARLCFLIPLLFIYMYMQAEDRCFIVTDNLSTPIPMHDGEEGKTTWDCTWDAYRGTDIFEGSLSGDCPFRYQGQYEDRETGLYYNRFRFFDPYEGMYISQHVNKKNIMNLTLDNWKGNINSEVYINNADYDMALQYLYKIDGDKHTEMLLEDNDFNLSIAGGNNGRYIINIYKNDDSFILFDDNHGTGELLLNCGGQFAEFDLKYCFDLNFAEKVLFEYFKEDNLFELYKWEIS